MARYIKRSIYLDLASISLCGCGESGRRDRYAGGGRFIGARPSMSPDGSLVVYSSPATGHGDIYRINADGSQRVRLTSDPSYDGSPKFSYDGTGICFMREVRGVGHIWIMDRDGGNARQLTHARESDEDPAFSHDGKRIVFCRRYWEPVLGYTASRAELCLINIDGSGEQRLTNNDEADWEPEFTPDDRGVIFSIWSDNIWLMPLDTRAPVRLAKGSTPSMGRDPNKVIFIGGEYGREIRMHDRSRKSTQTVYRSDRYLSHPSLVGDDRKVLFLEEPSANGTGEICLINLADGAKTIITRTGDETP